MLGDSVARRDSEQIRRNYSPEYQQWQAVNEIPVGRYGEPEDIANLCAFWRRRWPETSPAR